MRNYKSTELALLRKHYKEGMRVELQYINDESTELSAGDQGTISFIDDIGQIHVNWDKGSTIALLYDEDHFVVI